MAGPRVIPRPAVERWLSRRLEEVVGSGSGQLLSVRGRRQAGKSTVVEQFVEGSGLPYVFATGLYRLPERLQLEASAAAFADSRRPLPVTIPGVPSSWREWFASVALAASQGPVIAVLDEFPWITAGDDAGLEGILQVVWDRVLEKLPVLVVLIGSDVAMMERLAQHDRPLFGRVRELVVPAFDPGEVEAALPHLSAPEVFDAVMVTGGYPRLVTALARSGGSVAEWVAASLADDLSPLVATGRLSLDAEFADDDAVYRVLSSVGSGEPARLRLGEIVTAVADPGALPKTVETHVLRALRTLTEEKRVLERELPAWATSTRLRRYRLTDPYLRFWFRYVERHVEAIARGRGDVAAAAFERDWSSWRGMAVEPVVRRSLERLAGVDGRVPAAESFLPWWTRDGQVEVDVVGVDREVTSLLGTIKWRASGGVTSRDLGELAAYRSRVPRAAGARLAAISPTGEAPASADLALSADDLLAAWRVAP